MTNHQTHQSDNRISVAGLSLNALTKSEILRLIRERLAAGERLFVTTPYSEFLYAAQRDASIRSLLNTSDLALADGIGVLWAATYLSRPLHVRSFFLRWCLAVWQMVATGSAILFHPASLKERIPEKISGSDFVWDLAGLTVDAGYRMYLLGGFGDTTQKAAAVLRQKFPTLDIHASNKNPGDESIVADLERLRPDILLVAFGPIRQERWIHDHWDKIPVRLAIGVGGTFDYLAGTKQAPPHWVRSIGLEWLYRLFTQPTRTRRITRATLGLIREMIQYKVAQETPPNHD